MPYRYEIDQNQVKFFGPQGMLVMVKVQQESTQDPTSIPEDNSENRRNRDELRCKLSVIKVPARRPAGWKVTNRNKNGWRNWVIVCSPKEVIFPTREGESIPENVLFPEKEEDRKFSDLYTLTYPGTASTKTVVVFTGEKESQGFVVSAEPSLKWAELSLRPFTRKNDTEKKIAIRLFQREGDLYILPFEKNHKAMIPGRADETADAGARDILPIKSWKATLGRISMVVRKLNPELPRVMLQLGIRDPAGYAYIDDFLDQRLLDTIAKFRNELGPGNIIHLFGTNAAGFDNQFPDFSIDPGLGDKQRLAALVDHIHSQDLFTSHHFNPRIASAEWLKKGKNWWNYRKAVLRDRNGKPWEERYKNQLYYVMNPSHAKWQNYCIQWVRYFEDIGFDYIEMDQISYQRNIANPEDDIGTGFQDMLNLADKGPANLWTEGVSDIYKLPPGAWFQMLPRTRHEKWFEKNENRRGYIGDQRPQFYRSLMRNSPISYQVVMDSPKIEHKIKNIPSRLRKARDLDAVVLDLEIGFFNASYEQDLFPRVMAKIRNFAQDEGFETSIEWLNLWFLEKRKRERKNRNHSLAAPRAANGR